MVATEPVTDDQLPPPGEQLKVFVLPTHATEVPVMEPGCVLTVTVLVVKHPVDPLVNVIVVLPAATPVTAVERPDNAFTVAVPVAAELHVPPALVSLKVVTEPAHTACVPEMAPGNALTVICCKGLEQELTV